MPANLQGHLHLQFKHRYKQLNPEGVVIVILPIILHSPQLHHIRKLHIDTSIQVNLCEILLESQACYIAQIISFISSISNV